MSGNKLIDGLLSTDPKDIYKMKKMTQGDISCVSKSVATCTDHLTQVQKDHVNDVLEAMNNKLEISELDEPDDRKMLFEELDESLIDFRKMMKKKQTEDVSKINERPIVEGPLLE